MAITTAQMFDHTIMAKKGWFQPAALDYVADLAAAVTLIAYAGRVVSLNSVGAFEMGHAAQRVPIMLLNSSNSPDVINAGGTTWTSVIPGNTTPRMSGLVMTAPLELETTEYNTALTYAPNEPLRGQVSNTVQATGGVLTNAGITLFTQGICGYVSAGVKTNLYGKTVLQFWSHFVPGTA